MRFTTLAFLATLATLGATSPIAEHSPAGVALPRAINKADFTEAELANFTEEELANAGESMNPYRQKFPAMASFAEA